MLGYRGHFATKSRRYSTTLRALRAVRADYKRRQHLQALQLEPDAAAVTVAAGLAYAGRGWQTTGDALLALSAAARAREHRRIAREELTSA
jgi:glycine/D-amino acid oxidase-like deaminating enzyme